MLGLKTWCRVKLGSKGTRVNQRCGWEGGGRETCLAAVQSDTRAVGRGVAQRARLTPRGAHLVDRPDAEARPRVARRATLRLARRASSAALVGRLRNACSRASFGLE